MILLVVFSLLDLAFGAGMSTDPVKVMREGATEPAFSGKYYNYKGYGMYHCGGCGLPLFPSTTKFDSGSGWPSFDDTAYNTTLTKKERRSNVKEIVEKDGSGRIEIVCSHCGAHLGHVFDGERMTPKNRRHCANSVSLQFRGWAYFAGGCFWGVEYLLEDLDGVYEVISGYMGGHLKNPTYEEVSKGNTGHAETVKVIFDPEKITYGELVRHFFSLHDPTQIDRQGPDRGPQYRSVVFYGDEEQKKETETAIAELKKNYSKKKKDIDLDAHVNGAHIVTQLVPIGDHEFYPAENYHQDYYATKKQQPYCHKWSEKGLSNPLKAASSEDEL